MEACQRIDIAETLYRSRPTKLVVDRALAKAILQAASKLIFLVPPVVQYNYRTICLSARWRSISATHWAAVTGPVASK